MTNQVSAVIADAFGLEDSPDGEPFWMLSYDEAGHVLEGVDYRPVLPRSGLTELRRHTIDLRTARLVEQHALRRDGVPDPGAGGVEVH